MANLDAELGRRSIGRCFSLVKERNHSERIHLDMECEQTSQ